MRMQRRRVDPWRASAATPAQALTPAARASREFGPERAFAGTSILFAFFFFRLIHAASAQRKGRFRRWFERRRWGERSGIHRGRVE